MSTLTAPGLIAAGRAREIRERIVSIARGYAGVSVRDNREAYLGLVAPEEIEAKSRDSFAHPNVSGCALVARGVLRLAGIKNEGAASVLFKPYVWGNAVVDCVNLGKAVPGGWVPAFQAKGRVPQPGDLLLIGPPEHVCLITEQLAEDTWESIDGGQRDPKTNDQAIYMKHRKWVRTGAHILDVCEGLYGPRTRPVMGWIDVSKLSFDEPVEGKKGCSLPG